MYLFFHLDTEKKLALSEATSQIFKVLNIHEYQEHESSHYVDNIYFMGENSDYRVKVAHEDDLGFEEYRYWVIIWLNNPTFDVDKMIDEIAVKMLQNVFKNVALSLEDDPQTDENHVVRLLFELRSNRDSKIHLKKIREVVDLRKPK